MNRINQYEPIQCLQKFNQNIQLWLCENTEGDHFDVLTISKNESYERSLKRILSNEVKPLIDREISGFQKIVDVGFDSEQNVHYVAYKHFEGTPLNDNNAHVGTLKEIVKGLDELKKENKQAFILSPKYMIIDAMGMVKTRFVGLFELFRRENLLEEDYLSPNVQEWMNDTKHPRPNFQDDMYSLGKIFQNTLLKNHGEVGIRILEKCLALQRIERFSKYYELLELLEKIAIPKRKSSLGTIQIKTQQDWNDPKFKALLQSMNEQTWFLVDNERSKSKNQITGRFSTSDYNGRFFVDKKKYLFIDFKGCKEGKDERLIKHPESFLAYFSFDSSPHRFNCISVFKEKFDERNHLAQLYNNKKDAVKHWQTLPDKEREYIEERAFKAAYTKRTQSGNEATNIKFHLTEPTHKDWNRVKNLKNEEVVLFIDDQKIGKILDFHPQDKFIIIGDPYCSIDEIPKQGELIEDVRQETSQYKKQVEACKKFEKSDVINPSLCSILATPDRTAMPKTSFLKGWEYDNFKDELFDKKLKNDKTQCEAVLEALHHKPVYLIQGPPGTGKTTVIVELIRQLVKRQKDVKILVTSQSNLAVDNVLERLEKVNNEDPNNELKFMRLASEHAVEKESITPTISPYVFENKLKNWVGETEERSNAYFSQHFAKQEKQKVVIEFYQFFSQLDKTKDKDWDKLLNRLSRRPNYLKRLFSKADDFNAVEKVFEKELGKSFLKLKNLQRDWFAFLGGVTIPRGKDSKRSMLNNGSTEIDFLTAMMKETNVIGATCIHIASSKYSRVNFRFDYVIMDESSKASPAETLVPLNMGQNIVLIGDHKQLPPVVTREDAVKKKVEKELEDNGLDFDKTFGESLFEKLIKAFEQDEDKHNYIKMLDVQYRMPKQLGSLISKYFYDRNLSNPAIHVIPNFDANKHHQLQLKKNTSILFLSTSQRNNPSDNDNKFKRSNRCNVKVIQEVLETLNTLYTDNTKQEKPFNVGVIAGYRGQVELLKKNIRTNDYTNFISKKEKEDGTTNSSSLININTVDKFQGAERDIIIYDIVRSSRGQSIIGFLDDYRRINVAFSRAKRLLIIVGDSEYLLKRAKLHPKSKFQEFKLQQIAQELEQKGLIFNHLNEIFP